MEREEWRIVVVGLTGSGKSSTCNTILDRNEFTSKMSSESVTKRCKFGTSIIGEKRIVILDTPGLYDTKDSAEDTEVELKRCTFLTSPGPHAFLLVIRLGRFTSNVVDAIKLLTKMFGNEMMTYLIVLFTGVDDLDEGDSLQTYVQGICEEYIKEILSRCSNRFTGFNNKKTDGSEQVSQLLQMIEQMVEDNGGGVYTTDLFKKAEEIMLEEEEKERIKMKNDNQISAEVKPDEQIDRKKSETSLKSYGTKVNVLEMENKNVERKECAPDTNVAGLKEFFDREILRNRVRSKIQEGDKTLINYSWNKIK